MLTKIRSLPFRLKKWGYAALIISVIVLFDQASKQWIVHTLDLHQGFSVTSWFNVIRVHNPGAAFSFLAEAGGWQRWGLSILSLVAIAWMLWMMHEKNTPMTMALYLSLIIAGAIGNMLDRILLGHVIDFIDIHAHWLSVFFTYGHYPTFNIADISIFFGVLMLLGYECRHMMLNLRRTPR